MWFNETALKQIQHNICPYHKRYPNPKSTEGNKARGAINEIYRRWGSKIWIQFPQSIILRGNQIHILPTHPLYLSLIAPLDWIPLKISDQDTWCVFIHYMFTLKSKSSNHLAKKLKKKNHYATIKPLQFKSKINNSTENETVIIWYII